jgi:hypothetical protein
MIEISVSTFEDLKVEIDKLLVKFGRHKSGELSVSNSILYRGQADHTWRLESTLERATKRKWSLKNYLDLTRRIRPIIESYYSLSFSNPSREEIEEWLRYTAAQNGIVNMPNYDYLLYLRHHGFPSPFVDWTTSLYIAAGFAFFAENNAEYRSVFMFIESPTGIKGTRVGDPEISTIGRYVKTHKRHFLQQAEYTVCYSRVDETIPLEKYSDVLSSPEIGDQDLLWKFSIPSFEREEVLRFLASVNINPFSLMPSEENLLGTLWLNEVTLPDSDWARHNKKTEV